MRWLMKSVNGKRYVGVLTRQEYVLKHVIGSSAMLWNGSLRTISADVTL
jgi:hypothetical protein